MKLYAGVGGLDKSAMALKETKLNEESHAGARQVSIGLFMTFVLYFKHVYENTACNSLHVIH